MYRRLQVGPEASDQEVRRAYLRLAHEVHPDANPEDPEAARRFQEITEAYQILSRPERRARYDQARRDLSNQTPWPIATEPGLPASPPTAGLDGRVATGAPTVIGAGLSPSGSAYLVAGPVRVVPSGVAPDGQPRDTGGETSSWIEAIWSWWRS